jgi:hypothetical protein
MGGRTFGDNINVFNVILFSADGDVLEKDVDEKQPNHPPQRTTTNQGSELVRRAFQVIDVVSRVPGYRELCSNQERT